MVGDKGRSVVIEHAPPLSWLARARVDLRGLPIDFNDPNYLKNKNIINTDFTWGLLYKITGARTKRHKPYMIYLEDHVSYRFDNLDDLKAMAANEAGVAFVLKWCEPITQEMLDFARVVYVKIPLMSFARIKKYEEYLRDCVEEKTGHRPPPEQSMFIPDGFIDSVCAIEQQRRNAIEDARIEYNAEMLRKAARLKKEQNEIKVEVTEG